MYKRQYLQHGIADAFLERLVAVAKGIEIGDPMNDSSEMGPLCTQAQITLAQTQIKRAIEQGGKVLVGGKQPGGMSGQFFEPTIIETPDPKAEIVHTELFGPVLSVLRFHDEAEVLRLANESDYGLAAGIFTRDSARSLRMSQQIRAGIVWVNTYRAISPIAAFGGEKHSGYGREAGLQALLDYTRPKTIWMNTSDEPLANLFQPR